MPLDYFLKDWESPKILGVGIPNDFHLKTVRKILTKMIVYCHVQDSDRVRDILHLSQKNLENESFVHDRSKRHLSRRIFPGCN